MTPAGASNGDVQVCLTFLLVLWQRELDEIVELSHEVAGSLIVHHILADRLVPAVVCSQFLGVVRIDQESNIEH